MILRGNLIKDIPAFTFENSSALIDLKDLLIHRILRGAFNGVHADARIDLRGNFIEHFSLYAFDSTMRDFTTCTDKSWLVEDDDGETYDCKRLSSLSRTCTSEIACLDDVASLKNEESETAWTSCCEMGGGRDTRILMDVASPIFCESFKNENESFAIQCDCTSSDFFDIDNMNCITECEAGYEWVEVDTVGVLTVTDMISQVGHCVVCNPGEFGGGDLRKGCSLCDAGSYAMNEGSEYCYDCPRGEFAPERGAERCEPCPAGSKSPQGSSSCRNCSAGTFSPSAGSYSCFPCHDGYAILSLSCFLSLLHSQIHTNISSRYYTPNNGSTVCESCPEGRQSHQDVGSASCDPLPAGLYVLSVRAQYSGFEG